MKMKGVYLLPREIKDMQNLRHNFKIDEALDKYKAILKYKTYYKNKYLQSKNAEYRMLEYLKGKKYRNIKK